MTPGAASPAPDAALRLEPGDPQRVNETLAARLPAELARRNEEGLLRAADLHVAALMTRLPGGDQLGDPVLLAMAEAVAAAREGSSCVQVEDAVIRAALKANPMVTSGSEADGRGVPFRLVDDLLYLDRFWREERRVRDLVLAREAQQVTVDAAALASSLARLFPGEPPDRQRVAVARAVGRAFSVIAGGPGTGKTTTVARVLASLLDQHRALPDPGPRLPLRVALAAPTGKAAARLQSAVAEQLSALHPGMEPYRAVTLHRLIGLRPGGRPRAHALNPLPHDVVVVDETSMVSLPMLVRVLDAVRPDARLVMVGDPDQLASVEVGAVLADLVERPAAPPRPDSAVSAAEAAVAADIAADPRSDELRVDGARSVTRLTRGYRFGGGIADVADAVRRGDADAVLALLSDGGDETSGRSAKDTGTVRLLAPERAEALVREDVVAQTLAVSQAARDGLVEDALTALSSHQVLTAHRNGPFGATRRALQAQRWARDAVPGHASEHDGDPDWYVGRTVLVTRNDDDTGIANGDTGVVVRHPDGSGLAVAFDIAGGVHLVHPGRLPEVLPLAAITVHRSQGSQYARVSLILPEPGSPLLTRELLYTAITRAQDQVVILGTPQAVEEAVGQPARRASGLRRAGTWQGM